MANIKGFKFFDFDNDFDNAQILSYIMEKLSAMELSEKAELITYGEKIKFIKVQIESFEDVTRISEINGVKSVDFFSRIFPTFV